MRHSVMILILLGLFTRAQADDGTRFSIHTDPWLALHHYAYHQARALSDEKLRSRVPIAEEDVALFDDQVRIAFEPVRIAYDRYLDRDLLFDDELRGVAEALIAGGPDRLDDRELAVALENFMPVYRDVFWPAHAAAAEATRIRLRQLLEDHGDAMAERSAVQLEGRWPSEPIRVDVLAYANWAGAYTDNDPARHITIGARDEDIGAHLLEMIFHEASHTEPLGSVMYETATRLAAASPVDAPEFWHTVQFYAVGRAAKEVLGPGYTPYAAAQGLTEYQRFGRNWRALDAVWDKHATMEARCAAALALMEQQSGN
ncbi:hypothetical protein [Parvularcula lutaonensis]|uniref:DUF2268 domain-containing protein n=1 Tax=Parvularcula lutaonensis TaxID=491923 RepID=A0ABV7M9Z2_9PROT|nr:hypothetical protein [Parvularcula lutaonensis]GGY45765.1 hypothetical protein GCM10007148_13500 [Parvularcula lutaonensis]